MIVEGMERFSFRGSNCVLSGLETGNPEGPDMILIHGMRDHALSLMPLVREFSREFKIILPDLRGHGDSENPGSYTMMQFVADLRALIEQKQIKNPVIMGHSLGGHIASMYTSFYNDEVRALVLMDGIGPPRFERKISDDEARRKESLTRSKEVVQQLIALSSELASMPDKKIALSRLEKNNPLLSKELARIIVDYGVESHPEGGIRWKWDPSANMIWSTFSHDENEECWKEIVCPVLMLTGDRAMDYWSQMREELKDQQQFHDEEIERRRQLFKNAEAYTVSNAGHMLHYDQPEALNKRLRSFIDKLGTN